MLCQTLASRSPDKFDAVGYHLSARGTPILDRALAWIDCSLDAVHEAGDHHIAIGEVHALEIHRAGSPLPFHHGGYGKMATLP